MMGMEVFYMALIECSCCSSRAQDRSMVPCVGCGRLLCPDCARVEESLCVDCACERTQREENR